MAYTAQEVDVLVARLERLAERHAANQNSVVKLRASERDLLGAAEAGRDLLLKAVKDDKMLLQEVFGGTCERIGRVRHVLQEVKFSDMHAGDARWNDLGNVATSIESVLQQLGAYKPWQPPKMQPPSNIIYKAARSRYGPGETVMLKVELSGDEVSSFTVEPPLPDGLVLDPISGLISGKLPPGADLDEVTYIITVANEAGTGTAELTFAVRVEAPEALTYPDVAECSTGDAICWEASVTGGSPIEWLVEPDLPRGLSLTVSGAIQGVPLEGTERADYTVTASNLGGEVVAVASFEVKVSPPESLSYPGALSTYSCGEVINIVPEIVLKQRPDTTMDMVIRASAEQQRAIPLGMSYTVDPELPADLTLDECTGVVSGRAREACDEVVYKVTVSNEGGEASTEITLAFRLTPPASLTYPSASKRYHVGVPVSGLEPEVDGHVEEWAVEPELPEGLSLGASGSIDGTPAVLTEDGPGSWTITARNSEGECSTVLTFDVTQAPPANLQYAELLGALPLLQPVEFHPTVAGGVDEYSVSPSLPEGIELDMSTGIISGTPRVEAESRTYEIVAQNSTGSTSAEVTFEVKVFPPESLQYPEVSARYRMGEEVALRPTIVGVAESFAVDPPLPEGMVLDIGTGEISGVPAALADEASYVVTVSNNAGEASEALNFAIVPPPPTGLAYPSAIENYIIGEDVLLEPEVEGGACNDFSVSPALPEGLQLAPETGSITGAPVAPVDKALYTVTAKNIEGSISTVLEFGCAEYQEPEVDEAFAAQIDEITEIADLMEEPSQGTRLGDWMLWMVHRAYLNDSTLTDMDFTNKTMPYPYVEPRIAPKLMEALKTNTNITHLMLPNSNLQKQQGHELANALKVNTSLQIMNVETNNLDSDSIRAMAEALHENEDNKIEQWRFNYQKGVGGAFGRPLEEMVGQLMEKNFNIVKLGFSCNDPHWRNSIDRAILRNNDSARRNRRKSKGGEAEEIVAEDRTLSKLCLTCKPSRGVHEVFSDDDANLSVIRGYVALHKVLPTPLQLQGYAKSNSTPLKYSVVAPLIKDLRDKMLNSAIGTEVEVQDEVAAPAVGVLRAWSENNANWKLDVWPASDKRLNYTDNKQPIIEVSGAFAAWLRPQET